MKFISKQRTIMLPLFIGMLFLLVFAQGVSAQDIVLSASQETGYVGDTVTVRINITNARDTEGGQFDLHYGPTMPGATVMLEPVSASGGSFVQGESGARFDHNLNLDGNRVRVLWVIPEGANSDSGEIGSITFRIRHAGETTLSFSDYVIVDPRIGRMVATPISGRVTSLGEDSKHHAVRAADDAIQALPVGEWLQLSDKPAVENARRLVNIAKSDHGAIDADFTYLAVLEAAETRIAFLDAVRLADNSIVALPSVDALRLDDKPKVEDARYLVERAKRYYGAVDRDFVHLSRLVAAENRIRELEGRRPTPPTGEAYYLLTAGILVLIAGFYVFVRRKQMLSRQ